MSKIHRRLVYDSSLSYSDQKHPRQTISGWIMYVDMLDSSTAHVYAVGEYISLVISRCTRAAMLGIWSTMANDILVIMS